MKLLKHHFWVNKNVHHATKNAEAMQLGKCCKTIEIHLSSRLASALIYAFQNYLTTIFFPL